MEACLVTGGAGFIGSHLVRTLVSSNRTVRVLDNLSTGSLANLGRCARSIELIVGDLSDLALVREIVEGVGVVYHLAEGSLDDSTLSPSGCPCQCDLATAHVLIASRDCRVRRVVYASSTQVYGRAGLAPRSETDPLAPVTPFAQAKLSGEQGCSAFTLHYGLETVRLRYSNVFGPRQPLSSPHARVVPEALAAMLAGETPSFDGTGDEPQDLVFVDDVVRAMLQAAEARGASGRVYNIARGRPTHAVEVVDLLNNILGTGFVGAPSGRSLERETQNALDVSRAQAELGFAPTQDLRECLARCARYVALGIDGTEPGQRRNASVPATRV
jgi:UDP-glucose 4-epimerase